MPESTQQPLSAATHLNNGLFADYYLNAIMPGLPEWDSALFEAGKACFEQIRHLRAALRPETLDEAQLEERWIQPVLHLLGHHYAVQGKIRYRENGHRKPDYVFLASAAEAQAVTSKVYEPKEITHWVAVGDAKSWGAKLDQAAPGQRNPSQQIDEYLRYSERPWGILTDGRYWRLYHRETSKHNQYYAVDLDRLLEDDSIGGFLYFYAFFRLQAFTTGWLEKVLNGSEDFAQRLTDTLESEVFDALETLAQGFLDYRRNRLNPDAATLREIYEQSLVLLYRLLFIFYAESREILPMENGEYRRRMSMDSIKKEAANDVRFRNPSPGPSPSDKPMERGEMQAGGGFDADSGHYYGRLSDLFFAIDAGNPVYGVPPYNGRLFSDSEHPFLANHVVGDAHLVPALDKLARVEDNGRRVFVDYRDLEVRHLGSIYEKLLEYELAVAGEPLTVKNNQYVAAGETPPPGPSPSGKPMERGERVPQRSQAGGDESPLIRPGQVYLKTGSNERKVTGSYYTPDYIVRFIVEKTLEPLLTEITARHATQDAEGLWHVQNAEALVNEVLALNVLDPATGSGHFVVDVTAYIAEWMRGLGMRPADLGDEDELIYWKRQVASACIYAVDINPLAVELAKLSMWLATLAKGKPLSFLDHHIRLGNSLVGTRMSAIDDSSVSVKEAERRRKGRERRQQKKAEEGQIPLFSDANYSAGVQFAVQQMDAIERTVARDVGDVKRQEQLYADLTKRLSAWKQAADVWTARYFGLELTAEQWKAVRQFSASGMMPPAIQTLADEAGRLAKEHRFFHWELAFPEIFYDADGQPKENPGFDAVVGNPPYVRQERIQPIKPYLASQYAVYAGTADLYVYFYERAIRLLRPGGQAAYITANKWLRSGYGEALRAYLAGEAETRQLVDFGHAPIFHDADTFPVIAVLRKPSGERAPDATAHVTQFPRESLGKYTLSEYTERNRYPVPLTRFSGQSWSLENPEVEALMEKIRQRGVPLHEFTGDKVYRGMTTGLNEVFFIDAMTRNRLVEEDPKCNEIVQPLLRGENLGRWSPNWSNEWIILLKSSANQNWPWSLMADKAEEIFAQAYPSLFGFMKPFENRLRTRQDKGTYWWELRSCTYYDAYARPKLLYQAIQFHPSYSYDQFTHYTSNKCYMVPNADFYLLAVMNSPLMWWFNWRYLGHMKDEALEPTAEKMIWVPVAQPNDLIRAQVEPDVKRQLDLTRELQQSMRDVLEWLRIEFGVERPGNKLEEFATLTEDGFIAQVRQRGSQSLTPASLRLLREQFTQYSGAIHSIQSERVQIEHRLSDLVNQAYGLTADEIDLMWKTAPPRMPITKPDARP